MIQVDISNSGKVEAVPRVECHKKGQSCDNTVEDDVMKLSLKRRTSISLQSL